MNYLSYIALFYLYMEHSKICIVYRCIMHNPLYFHMVHNESVYIFEV